MHRSAAGLTLLLLLFCGTVVRAEEPKSEMIIENMSVKLVRGVTNLVTSVAELPKQTYMSVNETGAVGYVVGPFKGVGMTIYRALMGGAETVFFLVPQPGYYDPMIDPDFVWKGWRSDNGKPEK